MKRLMFITMLLIISISCYAQESQKSYTLLLLDFEDKSGVDNPLLANFNNTLSFVLSRQTGPVRVRLIPMSDRNALLALAKVMQPDGTPIERGLLAAGRVDADALVMGSYTKQGTQWSLQAEVYHLREGRKARQPIQIQGDSLYKLLDDFPAQLLKQFTVASYISLTTSSWNAYEAFRKGHEELQNYNFFGALEHYEKALELDPTLTLAYAEQSYAYFITGQGEQATEAINRAQKYVSQASPIEQMAIQALKFYWDAEALSYRYEHAVDFLTSGGAYDEEWLSWVIANAYEEEGRLKEAASEYERWFTLAEDKLRWKGDNFGYLLAAKCAGANIHLDKAIEYAERLPPHRRLVDLLIYLYGQQGRVEKAFQLVTRIASPPTENEEEEENIDIPSTSGLEYFTFGLGNDARWNALAQIILEHHVPLKRVRQLCRPLMDSDKPYWRIGSHYLLAWAHAREGDLEIAKSLYARIGAPWEQDWWVVGPFDGNVYDMDSVLPPEGDVHLNQIYEGAIGPVQWKRANDGYLDGFVELTKALDFPEEQTNVNQPKVIPGRGFMQQRKDYRRMAYALIYIESKNPKEATLWLDVDTDDFKWTLWLNDTIAFRSNEVVAGEGGPGCPIPAQLHGGLNKILIKALQLENHGLNFAFRVTDPNGNPIPGLRFRSASEVLGSGEEDKP